MKKLGVILSGVVVATFALHAGKNVMPVESEVIPVVQPSNPLYIGVAANWVGTSRDCPCAAGTRLKDSTYGGMVRVGANLSPYLGIEGRILKANIDEDFADTLHYGVYMKPQFRPDDATNIYGLVGLGTTDIDFTCATASSTFKSTNVSLGGGIEHDLSGGDGENPEGWGVFMDAQSLLYQEGTQNINSTVVSAGVMYDF